MNRKDLQVLSEKRLKEAQSLFRARLYEGSYHLAGLAVECAAKACIARQSRLYEFPDKTRANNAFEHHVAKLVQVAGLQTALGEATKNPAFAANWNTVLQWRVESRYTLTIKRADAAAFLLSLTDPNEGVLSWLHSHW